MMFIPVFLEANERVLLENTGLGSHELREKFPTRFLQQAVWTPVSNHFFFITLSSRLQKKKKKKNQTKEKSNG